MRLIVSIAVASLMALAACDGYTPPPTSPGTAPTDPVVVETPYECPAGMPAYKCEQLKAQNNGTTPLPQPPT